ncbi:MAG: helix-turn-helix transcriptional regulator [Rhodomicrobium sp.]
MSLKLQDRPASSACESCPSGPDTTSEAIGPPSLLHAVLDLRPFPVFLLRPDLTIGVMNLAASRSLRQNGMAISPQGMLRLAGTGADERLGKMLRTFASERSKGGPQLLPFELPDGALGILKVEALAVPPFAEAGAQAHGIWFELSLRTSRCCLKIPAGCLAAVFQLTSAEAHLASALAEGLSLRDYAAREGLKITTVRWHLQNIFARTGARSQSGLVRTIVSLFA